MSPRARVAVAWLPSLAYMSLIWVVSSIEQPFDLSVVPFKDKGIHFVEYGVLAFLNARAARRTWKDARWPWLAFVAAGSAFLWGYLDEIHQAFVPGRNAALSDVAANALGALVAVALYLAIERRFWRGPGEGLGSRRERARSAGPEPTLRR